ncbi:MAG: hypothetical protein U5L72_08440 [Bacteroidales bacterium]|nr:hypothetical protein [Bacteroidales bacterium]
MKYYRVVNEDDYAISRALTILTDPVLYDRMLGYPEGEAMKLSAKNTLRP